MLEATTPIGPTHCQCGRAIDRFIIEPTQNMALCANQCPRCKIAIEPVVIQTFAALQVSCLFGMHNPSRKIIRIASAVFDWNTVPAMRSLRAVVPDQENTSPTQGEFTWRLSNIAP